ISCCEVLNSLIFPAHEQHHNNSFLCAALIMGQSNIAAGATIGSNHNSRGADGEIVVGRGFWPGLCVSIKHNSKFASFTIIAKADYSFELNIPIPFSLISLDASKDQLTIMPGYWFMYNMYALARNSWKYIDRDKRGNKIQQIEYDYLAPDTVNELFYSIELLEELTGNAFYKKFEPKKSFSKEENIKKGRVLLTEQNKIIDELEIAASGFENSKRKTVLIKVKQSYLLFKEMIHFYGTTQLMAFIKQNKFKTFDEVIAAIPNKLKREEWLNIGGQLMTAATVQSLKEKVKKGKIKSWDGLHEFYTEEGTKYAAQKMHHALASLAEINDINLKNPDAASISGFLNKAVATKEWMTKSIYQSREKDYSNPYRKMIYDTQEEMDKVVGKLADNSFIAQQKEDAVAFKKEVASIKRRLK
ncbi:MAG: DUF4954 family protein, partial [Bacteroidota bacterium]|nr:DUF4954 family protein [Bacteroidota bacterium]